MGSVITFIIILSVLILVHELGHFVVARKNKIKIEEFGFGYPPRIWGKKIGETIFSINWLRFGGFVRMLGEDSDQQVKNKKDLNKAFFMKKKRVRIAVLMAGVLMNFLLGVVLFGVVYTKLGIPEPVNYVVVTGVVEESPADKAGIKAEDKILAVEGLEWPEEKKKSLSSFVEFVNQRKGEELLFTLDGGDEKRVTPRLDEEIPEGQGALGVAITNVDFVLYPVWQRPFRGMWVGVVEALAWGEEIIISLGKTFYGLFQGDVPKDVAGPVGIYEISKGVSKEGFLAILQFVAILSINLSILNLLPLPALDGGRLMFVGFEAITRKRVNPKIEQLIHLVGILLLISLMVLVTVNDVKRLVN